MPTANRTSANGRTLLRKRFCGRFECRYTYCDPWGQELFCKVRWRHDGCCDRDKSFTYEWRPDHTKRVWREDDSGKISQHMTGRMVSGKPLWADWYLYHLESWWLDTYRGEQAPIYWCEGEKDADRMAGAGALATSHHGGAGSATYQQASWLLPAAQVIIVADRDSAGAYDAIRRIQLLDDVGYAGDLDVRVARAGKDAYDHLTAGYRPAELRPADMTRMRQVAEEYRKARSTGRVPAYVKERNSA